MICCLNGKFLKVEKAKISILDHGFLYSDGFYDTMKAYYGYILDIEAHIKRVEKSLKVLRINLPWPMSQIRQWIEKVARVNPMKLSRVRMTITRGVNDFDFNGSKKPTLSITSEPIVLDKIIYSGVPVITVKAQRVLPEVKTLGVTAMILARSLLTSKKAFEALLADDSGFIREGTVTNLFWVKNGVLFTTKNRILNGITRNEIFRLSKETGFKIIEKDVKKPELLNADEIFISNTKFGIVPVLSIDKRIIANGKPGVTTKRIMTKFDKFIEAYFAKNSDIKKKFTIENSLIR